MDITPITTQQVFASPFEMTQQRADRRYEELLVEFSKTDGLIETSALFDLDGNWTPAKLVDSKYGWSWLVLDENGRSTGVFVPYASKKRETQAKRGFVEGKVRVSAQVALYGGFRPTAGIIPVNPLGTEKPVVVVSTDRFQEGK
jgi:hypothetical protein